MKLSFSVGTEQYNWQDFCWVLLFLSAAFHRYVLRTHSALKVCRTRCSGWSENDVLTLLSWQQGVFYVLVRYRRSQQQGCCFCHLPGVNQWRPWKNGVKRSQMCQSGANRRENLKIIFILRIYPFITRLFRDIIWLLSGFVQKAGRDYLKCWIIKGKLVYK